MEYGKALEKYGDTPTPRQLSELLAGIKQRTGANTDPAIYTRCLNCTDMTQETPGSRRGIEEFTLRVLDLGKHYPGMGSIASVCVYPDLVETAGLTLGSSDLPLGCRCATGAAGQTFIEVKMLETAMAIEQGANEVEIAINTAAMLDGEYEAAGSEIEMLRGEAGEDVTLKVSLEVGTLGSTDLIYKAALIAMTAGADFVCTSTNTLPATPEAAATICSAIKAYYDLSERRVGFKTSGLSSAHEAAFYYTMAGEILGAEWLNAGSFRIEGIAAANDLLNTATGRNDTYFRS